MTFLFIASIGPVQPFIASARRTRDLYGGSTLLSELSKAAASAIAEQEGGIDHLIFPAPPHKDDLQPGTPLNVANKIVAVVNTPLEQMGTLGDSVREAIERRLENIQKKAFGTLLFANEKAAQEQLANLIEYSWVAVPFNPDDTYKKTRRQAEAVLAARKNTSLFAPATWGSEQEKSSIDGKLECVIPAHLYNGQQEKNAKVLYQWYNAGPHERLSAVDLLKRLSAEQLLKSDEKAIPHVILSTSHIAATPFLQQLNRMTPEKQEKARGLWGIYIAAVEELVPSSDQRQLPSQLTSPLLETLPSTPQGSKLPEKYLINDVIDRYDGALLFEERLLDDMVKKEKEEKEKKFKKAQSALKEFFKAVGMRPSPYYALLLADGDGMGKAIENHAHGQDGPQRHRELSQLLSRFSMEVAAIVHKYYGALIYAGGDDIMALLPLDTALECAYELAQDFRKTLDDFRYLDTEGKEKSPTLSAGIAVIHHVSLLDEALALARQAEYNAKEQAQKNSLAIIIRKRSGEDYPLVVSWPAEKVSTDAQSGPLVMSYEHLKDLIALYSQNALPKGTAYELRDMVQRLQPTKGDEHSETLRRIIQIDAARILRRKLMLSDADNEKETGEALVKLLQFIGIKKGEQDAFQVEYDVDINQFINALIVAQTFAEPLEEQKEKEVPSE